MATPGMEEIEDILDPPFVVPEEFELEMVDILPRGYLSVSQMSTFLKCPYSWYLKYIEGMRGRPSARMFQGIQVHAAVEQLHSVQFWEGKLPSLDFATDVFATAFEAQKPLIEDWEGEAESSVKDTGVKCTETYYQEAAAKAMPISVEKTFHTIIKSEDGKIKLPVFGRIDSLQVQALNDKEYQGIREMVADDLKKQQREKKKLHTIPKIAKPLRINDLKVVTDKWTENDLKNDLQFAIYAGVEHIPDVQVDQVVKGRAKTPRPRYEVLNDVITPKQVIHATRVAMGVAEGIAKQSFPMTDPGNWWCSEKWCGVWFHCRGK